jgi:hypothetical protein
MIRALALAAVLAFPLTVHADPLADLAAAAKCSDAKSVWRPWCIATDGWSKGTAAALPAGKSTLLGLTIVLENGKPAADALSNQVSLSALALRTDGKQVFAQITNVKPSNPEEEKMTAEAVFNLAAVMKDKAPKAKVDKGLLGYLQTLPDAAKYVATQGKTGWTWEGASSAELRKVGNYWVAIETPKAKNGVWISIFTDRVEAK